MRITLLLISIKFLPATEGLEFEMSQSLIGNIDIDIDHDLLNVKIFIKSASILKKQKSFINLLDHEEKMFYFLKHMEIFKII